MNDPKIVALVSVLLVLGNAFFVAAEYALISSRKARIQALGRKRKKNVAGVLKVMDDISPYVAASQIGITLISIITGSITEPFVTKLLTDLFGKNVSPTVGFIIASLLVTYVLVVIGELFPKYLSIRASEKVVLYTTAPLVIVTKILMPLVWLAQTSAALLLKPFGITLKESKSEAIPRDELILMIRTGSMEGMIEKVQAELLARALRLDKLDAKDVMIHRIDIKSIDVTTPKEELFRALAKIPHTRIPVRKGDIDELLGIVYLHDIIKNWERTDFSLEKLIHPPIAVPENLTLDRILGQMRENKTQIVIVMDEYGGTSGLITLEDIVEEVFGELEDQLEKERPPIEIVENGRITARAEVRYDELIAFLELEPVEDPSTNTLATIIINKIERLPKIGDQIETELGAMHVENMARRRITRVSLVPKPNLKHIHRDL